MGKLLARMMRARLLLTLFALCGVGIPLCAQGTGGTLPNITTTTLPRASHFYDIDGDGEMEFVYGNLNESYWNDRMAYWMKKDGDVYKNLF